jgi:Crinkler effector protein N-terminal domain
MQRTIKTSWRYFWVIVRTDSQESQVVTLSLPPTTMANLKIFFFLLGDSSPSNNTFSITASPDSSVSELKDEVYDKKQNGLKGIDSSDLHLWKVLPLCSFHRIMC